EGGLTLRFQEIHGLQQVVRNLVSSGMLVTWLIVALATHLLLGFDWNLSFLFGAVMVVTGPTVIVPLLRTVRPNARISNILRWEGIVIDPIGALLAVLVFEFIISGQGGSALTHTLAVFGTILVVGFAMGAAAGYLLGLVLRHHLLPEYLHNVATLVVVFGVFAFSNAIAEESGLLTVTVMGIWLANMKQVPMRDILNFKESLSVLLISGLFIILAARIETGQFARLGWGAVALFLAIQFVARPAKVFVSTLGSSLEWRERALLAWIGPRGIVAAAVTALFAMRLQQQNYPGAELLVPLAFTIIIGTVVVQSATAGALARLLGVAEPEPKGFLIIGANSFARAIGRVLRKHGFRAVLTDTNWAHIKEARVKDGLDTFYGNPVSDYADRHLNLVGMGRMLGLSRQSDLNALASLKYRTEFGRNGIYTLQSSADVKRSEKLNVSGEHRGHILFGEDVTYSKLASLMSQGAEIRSTLLTKEFDFDAYRGTYGSRAIPLFALGPKGNLECFVAGGKLAPQPGWTVIALIQPEKRESAESSGR
ncbi:MAG TPA: sodium:proton antiporter, partial [Gammaproteobacteria bacterium]|nr:sodium:proton antiporter [Gammaproteobacteria bacterium]